MDRQNPNNFINTFTLKSIQNKLYGDAKIAVNIQTCTSWDDLKSGWRRNFTDQRQIMINLRFSSFKTRDE